MREFKFVIRIIALFFAFCITTTSVLLYNIITYPLSIEDVINNIESKNVVAYQENQGAWVYVVNDDNNNYICYVVIESIFLSRYRYFRQIEYSNDYVSTVPGKSNIFALTLNGDSIELTYSETRRLDITQFISFLLLNLSLYWIHSTSPCPNLFSKYRQKLNKTCIEETAIKRFIVRIIVLFVVLCITTTFVLLYNIFTYPLLIQDVINDIESKNVVAYQENQGVWVYVVNDEKNNYICYVVIESIFLNRYRHYRQLEYSNDYISTVPGKFNFFTLTLDGDSIKLKYSEASRLKTTQFINFLLLNLFFSWILTTIPCPNFSSKYRQKLNKTCVDNINSSE